MNGIDPIRRGNRIRTLRNLRAAEKQAVAVYVEEGHWVAVARSATSLVAIETELNCLTEEQERWREHESSTVDR